MQNQDPKLISLSNKLKHAINSNAFYGGIEFTEVELQQLSSIVKSIVDLGIDEDLAIEFFLRNPSVEFDISIFQLLASKYHELNDTTSEIQRVEKDPKFKELCKEFTHSVVIIYEILKRTKPEFVIFPLRGAEPLRWAISQVETIIGDNEVTNKSFPVPLGTTYDINTDPAYFGLVERGISDVAYTKEDIDEVYGWIFEEGNEEIIQFLKDTLDINFNRNASVPKKLAKVIKKMFVLKQYLRDDLSSLENGATISIVDEVVSGGTMSHLIIAIRLLLLQSGLDNVKVNVISFQHNEFLDIQQKRSKSYHRNLKLRDFDWLEVDETIGNFFTIDRRGLLPAVFQFSDLLRQDKGDEYLVSTSYIENPAAEGLIKHMVSKGLQWLDEEHGW